MERGPPVFREAGGLLRPGGVFAAYDYDVPPLQAPCPRAQRRLPPRALRRKRQVSWAGVILLRLVAGGPEPDPRLRPGIPVPEYTRAYRA
jgi:hypothetical protein